MTPVPGFRPLVAVVPIGRTVVRDAIALTLFVLEIYPDGFDIQVQLDVLPGHPMRGDLGGPGPLPAPKPRALFPDPVMAADDNVGTHYQVEPRGGRLSSTQARLEFGCSPGPGPAARTVTVEISEVVWRSMGEHGDAAPERVDLGPWTFAIDLTRSLPAERDTAEG